MNDRPASQDAPRVLVWDIPTRLFHWLLVLSLAGSWWTARAGLEWIDWHFRFGYFAGGLIVFRLVWGFAGPRHARFTNFLRSPIAIISYARQILNRNSAPFAGHNPLGGVFVMLFLLLITLQVTTGLFATDDIFSAGPFNPLLSNDLASTLTSIHRTNFDAIFYLVCLHIAAIAFYRFWKRQELTWPMIIGSKKTDGLSPNDAITSSRLIAAILIAAMACLLVMFVLSLAPEVTDDFF